jgi:hypothetical protein
MRFSTCFKEGINFDIVRVFSLLQLQKTEVWASSDFSIRILYLIEYASGVLDRDELRGRIESGCPPGKTTTTAPKRHLLTKADSAATV